MTSRFDPDFDAVLAGWMADGPERAPDTVVRAAVEETRSMAQAWPIARPRTTSVRWLAVAAILVATVVALVLVTGGTRPSPDPEPSIRAFVPPSDSTKPAILDGVWATRATAGDLPGGRYELQLGDFARVEGPDGFVQWLRPVTWSRDAMRIGVPPGEPCLGQAGVHGWTLAAGDDLRFEAIDEPCARRSAALDRRPWARVPLGETRAGTYRFDELRVPIRITIPDGLSLGAEVMAHPVEDAYLDDPRGASLSFAMVSAAPPGPCLRTGRVRLSGLEAVADRLTTLDGLSVTDRGPIDLGGRSGRRLDVRTTSPSPCDDGLVIAWIDPQATGSIGSDHNGLWLAPGWRATVDLFEVDGLVVAVVVAAPDELYDSWSDAMTPVLDSMTIEAARDTSLDEIP